MFSLLPGSKKKTKVIKNNVNPVWNEVSVFCVSLMSKIYC